MREPVATLLSLRRMEHLMFGPHLKAPLDVFLNFHLRQVLTFYEIKILIYYYYILLFIARNGLVRPCSWLVECAP